MAQMTKYQRAAQFWSLLVLAARTQQLLSYKSVEKMTGIPQQGQAGYLGLIQRYCERQDIPRLNVLVINEKGLPGLGFHGNFEDQVEIFRQQASVFVFDWFKIDPPTPEQFEDTEAPSLK